MWREIAKLTATRKEYTSALAKAAFKFSEDNNLHRDIQLAYVPGYDAIRIFHLQLDMVYSTVLHTMMPWSGQPVSLIMIYGDFTSCFSNISNDSREQFIKRQSVPSNRARGYRAVHKGARMFMVDSEGNPTQPIDFTGGWQGCPGSNSELHLSTCTMCQAFDDARVGFILHDGTIIKPQNFCDDLMLPIGGVGVMPRRAEELARSACKDILLPWTQESGQYFKLKKCGVMAIFVDQYGVKTRLNPDVQLLTEQGITKIPVHNTGDTVKALGVYRGMVPGVSQATNQRECIDKVMTRVKVYTHDAMPLRGRKALITVSAMGGPQWLALNTHMDKVWRDSLNKTQRFEIKAAMGLQPSTPTAFLHAPEPYGLGIQTIEHKYNSNNLAACISDLNHHKKLARDTVWRAATFTAQCLGIPKRAAHLEGSDRQLDIIFLDWEVTTVTAAQVMKWKLQNQFTDALCYCINSGWSLLKSTQEWGLANTKNYTNDLACTSKTSIRSMMNTQENHMWIAQLKSAARTIPTIYAATTEAAYITAWLRDIQVQDSIFRFTLKMWLSQLPTLENIAMWNRAKGHTFVRNKCACECNEKGTAAHIFSGSCSFTRGRATVRHNEVGKLMILDTMKGNTARWSYTGELDEAVPAQVIGCDWKWKIPLETITDRDGVKKQVRHTKPDLILADLLSKKRCVVLIIDFTIVAEHMFQEATDEKNRKYAPLIRAIREFLGEGQHRVEVLAVPIGRNGVPPPDWAKICSRMKISSTPLNMWKRVQSCIMEENYKMFSMWQSRNGLR
jgi:hypothetical protein